MARPKSPPGEGGRTKTWGNTTKRAVFASPCRRTEGPFTGATNTKWEKREGGEKKKGKMCKGKRCVAPTEGSHTVAGQPKGGGQAHEKK